MVIFIVAPPTWCLRFFSSPRMRSYPTEGSGESQHQGRDRRVSRRPARPAIRVVPLAGDQAPVRRDSVHDTLQASTRHPSRYQGLQPTWGRSTQAVQAFTRARQRCHR
jgi:hypothetical protein